MTYSRLSNRSMLPLFLLAALCIYGCSTDAEQDTAAPMSEPADDRSTAESFSEEEYAGTKNFVGGQLDSDAVTSRPAVEGSLDESSPAAEAPRMSSTTEDTETAAAFGADAARPMGARSSQPSESLKTEMQTADGAAESDSPAAPGNSPNLAIPLKKVQSLSQNPTPAPLMKQAERSRGLPSGGRTGEARPAAPGRAAHPLPGPSGGEPAAETARPAATASTTTVDELATIVSTESQKLRQLDLLAGEELWVIARNPEVQRPANEDARPGCGALMATLPGQKKTVPVPLKHTEVKAGIDGYVATVNVRQQFHNPYDSKIEAAYVFPLPEDAAINEFVMTVGDRTIRGIIREREQAQRVYEAARARGHVAALMTQERPNIFTQKVANIEPGKQIDIDIRYFNTLPYHDGRYEFTFPMVVGPRFNPPATQDGVGAVARNHAGSSGHNTEVSYLAPDERSGHDVSMTVTINAGVPVESVHSVNHAIDVEETDSATRVVRLSAADTIPNRDFVLRYQVAGDRIRTAMMTHKDKHGQYFTMMLVPPADLQQVNRSPMEMVFVLDCSGSMKGKPIAQAKAAISHTLQSLTPRDTFQIIQFSNNASQLGSQPLPATPENIQSGLQYLTSLNSTGGTHMIEGIKAALDFPHDEGRFRVVSFMTDGFIGNEQQILQTLHDRLGSTRVFSFGVGSSPNRFLMDRMAIVGRGAVAYLSLNEDAVAVMEEFNRRISHPAMTDISIDWGTMQVTDVYPQRLPDLIVGRPIIVTGRYRGDIAPVSVNGRIDLQPTTFVVENAKSRAAEHSGIAAVWARLKIKDMMNLAGYEPAAAQEIKATVLQTALNYNLMSAFTAFVAVDSMTKTAGNFGTTVAVPVPVPEGVRYDTTVPETN